MSTPIERDQFLISPKGIIHTPTGWTYVPHPGAPHAGTMDLSPLELAGGEVYGPHEVQMIMHQLWGDYVTANPRLFDVFD
jgi:hypothetical protein